MLLFELNLQLLVLCYYFTLQNLFGTWTEDEKMILSGEHYQLTCLYHQHYYNFFEVSIQKVILFNTHLKSFVKFTVTLSHVHPK